MHRNSIECAAFMLVTMHNIMILFAYSLQLHATGISLVTRFNEYSMAHHCSWLLQEQSELQLHAVLYCVLFKNKLITIVTITMIKTNKLKFH